VRGPIFWRTGYKIKKGGRWVKKFIFPTNLQSCF
jgi:hypothetical protein